MGIKQDIRNFLAAGAAYAVSFGTILPLFFGGLRDGAQEAREITVYEDVPAAVCAVTDYEDFFGTENYPQDIGCYGAEVSAYPQDIGCADLIADSTEMVFEGAGGITATADELEIAARILHLEAEGESAECQRYIADCIFNRLRLNVRDGAPIVKEWGTSLYSVLSAVESSGAFAFTTWAEVWAARAEPTDAEREIIRAAFEEGSTIPARIMYFATSYQSWAIPEFPCDHTYFSSSPWLVGVVE